MLELLVHVDDTELPPDLFVMTIQVDDSAPFYEIHDSDLPDDWRRPENLALKDMGDRIFKELTYIGIKARSAVMPQEYNFILNPLFPRYYDLVQTTATEDYKRDERL